MSSSGTINLDALTKKSTESTSPMIMLLYILMQKGIIYCIK